MAGVVAALLLGAEAGALAQGPPAKLFVVNFTGDVSPKLGAAMAEKVSGELKKAGLDEPLTAKNLEDQLGQERTKELLGCKKDSCVNEIVDGFGIADRLFGVVTKLGRDKHQVSVSHFRKGRLINKVVEDVSGTAPDLGTACAEIALKAMGLGKSEEVRLEVSPPPSKLGLREGATVPAPSDEDAMRGIFEVSPDPDTGGTAPGGAGTAPPPGQGIGASSLRITAIAVAVAKHKPNGDEWDAMGGPPDLLAQVYLDDAFIASTPKEQDSRQAHWTNLELTLAVHPGSELRIELKDMDMAINDTVGEATLNQTQLSQLLANGMVSLVEPDEAIASVTIWAAAQ
jgi:hypothetical protein